MFELEYFCRERKGKWKEIFTSDIPMNADESEGFVVVLGFMQRFL